MSPYIGKTFFQFFFVFFSRFFQFMWGNLSWNELASDEIQVFVLCLIAIAATLVGSLLILKKMAMLANSLSHTILLGIVLAYLLFLGRTQEALIMNFQILIVAALATGILTTFLTQFLHQKLRLQEDASIGLVFTSLFAIGILLVTLFTRNTHIGLEIVMGNVDALHKNDLKIAFSIAIANLFFISLFYKEWKLICFDQGLASSLGYRPNFFNYLLMLLTSSTAISAFRAVGVLLFLAFLVGLPLTARLLTHQLHKILFLGSVIGCLASLVAVAISRHLLTMYQMPLSTAGLVVTLIGIAFFKTVLIKFFHRRLTLRT